MLAPLKVKDYMNVLTKLKDDFQFHCRKCCLNCQTYKSNKRCRQYSQPRPLGLVLLDPSPEALMLGVGPGLVTRTIAAAAAGQQSLLSELTAAAG